MFTARIESVSVHNSYAYNLSSSDASQLESVLHSYFGSSISANQVDSLLKYYGITPTGMADDDIEALYNAMMANATSQVNSSLPKNQTANVTEDMQAIPWANLMSRISIAASGDLALDKSIFYSKISEMQQSSAVSSSQQATINELLAEAGIVFVSLPQQQEQPQLPTASGADIAALMNKQFFFGGSMST